MGAESEKGRRKICFEGGSNWRLITNGNAGNFSELLTAKARGSRVRAAVKFVFRGSYFDGRTLDATRAFGWLSASSEATAGLEAEPKAAIENIESLTRLEDLWSNDNQIPTLNGIEAALAGSREKLTTIYLERNPCAKTPNYSATLKKIFPNLEQIDSDIIA